MQNNELTDIERSVQALVRRAYELGRSDVLTRVVGVLKTDQPVAEELVLTGPSHDSSGSSMPQEHGFDPESPPDDEDSVLAQSDETSSASGPWWARPPR